MKLPLSKAALLLAFPFVGIVLYEAYLTVGLISGSLGSNEAKGFSLVMSAAQPWRTVLKPVFGEIYALLGTRSGVPVNIFWLVCTAFNAFLAYLLGSLVSPTKLSKVGLILGGGYLIVCLLVWAFVFASIKTANLSGLTLTVLAEPLGLLLLLWAGKLGIILAMLFNAALLYYFGSFLGLIGATIKSRLTASNAHT